MEKIFSIARRINGNHMAVVITVPQVSQEIKKPLNGRIKPPKTLAALERLRFLKNRYIKAVVKRVERIICIDQARLKGNIKKRKFKILNGDD